MGTFSEQIGAIEIANTKVVTFEPPRMWWHNGVRQAKTGGSFYTRASDFPNGLTEPWQPVERFDNEAGYAAESLRIAVLAMRSQAFRKYKDAAGKEQVEWLNRWVREEGVRIYTEVLCLVEGYDEPVVLAIKGLTGKAFSGILQTYRNGLLKTACRVAGRALPEWTFWLPIASKRQPDGKFAYEDTGHGSLVTPPALFLPDNAMDTLFVGKEILERGADALRQYAGWETAKRLPADTVEAEVITVPALPAPGQSYPDSVVEAEQRFYDRYADVIGGRNWSAVQAYLQTAAPPPKTIEGWISVAEATRDNPKRLAAQSHTAGRNVPQPLTDDEQDVF